MSIKKSQMGDRSFRLCSHQLTGSFAKGRLKNTHEFYNTVHHRAKSNVSLFSI